MAHKGSRWTEQELSQFQEGRATKQAQLKQGMKDKPSAKKKEPAQPETIIQQHVVRWFAVTFPDIYKTGALFAVPNEGKRTRATASRMKAEGMFPGVADLILLLPRGGFHGACIEMKSKSGRMRPEQSEWLENRKKDGYFVVTCYSYEGAVNELETYMLLKNTAGERS